MEIKMNKQMETFSFSPTINLSDERKWLLAVTSFETTNSVFNITLENNRFSFTIPGHWNSKSAEEVIDELNKLLELSSQNDTKIYVTEVRKKRIQLKIGDKEYKLSELETQKKEIFEELKNVKYIDLEDLV